MVSFSNTTNAFAAKSTKELKKSLWLFRLMDKPWLVKLGLTFIPFAVRWNFPFIRYAVRNTIFQEFVGGETFEQTTVVTAGLQAYKIQVILDYGVEAGEVELVFNQSEEAFIKAIHHAATQPNIPFISVKLTALARFALLEELDVLMHKEEGDLVERYQQALKLLDKRTHKEWELVFARLERISYAAASKNIRLLIDAEESWIQEPIDAMVFLLMQRFNEMRALIYNTVQLYRQDRMIFLENTYTAAIAGGFIPGFKLVRGAYLEKENAHAKTLNYPSPIHADKAATDSSFNTALAFCIDRLNTISVMIATHNEQSNLLAIELLQEKSIPAHHPHIYFAQLYGMGDHISYNIAKEGYRVCKYLPYGPLVEVIPYLMRRAQENSSIGGQTNSELLLIKKELKRRATE